MSNFFYTRRLRSSKVKGFTLVELLVVIGIIAVLIGILLPALSAARKQAQQVKCATALQEIGLGFIMYANEMKGYWPLAKMDTVVAGGNPPTSPFNFPNGNYQIDDQIYNSGVNAADSVYWTNFIAPFVNATKIGNAAVQVGNSTATVTGDMAAAKKTVLWGCPAWEQYQNYTVQTQTGYGMNGAPGYKQDAPTYTPTSSESCQIVSGTVGRFYKQVEWTNPGGRALVGDSIFWFMEAEAPPASPPYSQAISALGQNPTGNAYTYTGPDQTMVDIYRHGKKPSVSGSGSTATFDPSGGKVGYNMLFCDGHVGEFSNAQPAYEMLRQRFPG